MDLLWREVKKHKGLLTGALVLATVNQVFSLLDPQIFRLIIDNYATSIDQMETREFVLGVGLLLLAAVLVALISRIAKAFQDYYVNVITQQVGTDLYALSVGHTFALPYSVFEDRQSGEVLNKLQKARTDSQALIANSVNILFLSVVGVIFVIGYAVWVHPLIGLVYFLIIPTLAVSVLTLSRKIKQAQQEIVSKTAALSGSTTETLRNVELVKSLGLEDQEIDRLNDVNQKILILELKKVKMVRTLDFIQGTLINALRSALLLLMLWLIFEQAITLGEFFTLMLYSFFVFNPLSQLGTVATSYQEARASLAQLQEILSLPPTVKPETVESIGAVEKVEFDRVELKYDTGGGSVISDFSLTINSGQTVALVGPSGAGKSSLIKLLVGLYLPTKGSVKINGVTMDQLDIDGWRRRIGLVAQETQLFAGTIRENLLFVKPTASDSECLEVLRQAQALRILEVKGTDGLDTLIGEGGIKLSGGERQRLAIARALLREPEVLIFDEATSSLDSLTEQEITETIKQIEKDRPELIQILVAHRLSTVVHADLICVLEKGRLLESGTHQELLSKSGLYQALWRQQLAEG